MIRLIDSHCHLDMPAFARDRDGVIAAAEEVGVIAIVNPGVDLESSQAAVALAERHSSVVAAVGVHPHHAESLDRKTLLELRRLACHPRVVAVGEIGLDFFRNLSPADAQRRAFAAQLELAAELALPVIVHNRDATEETMTLLTQWTDDDGHGRGVLHSYAGGTEYLAAVLDLQFYVGLSGPVTFPGAIGLQEVAKQIPLDRLLVETDAPYLTPAPHRGRRNQPAYVRYVTERVANLRGLSPAEVGRQTTENVLELFTKIGKTLEHAEITGTGGTGTGSGRSADA